LGHGKNLYKYIIFITKYWGGKNIVCPPCLNVGGLVHLSPLKLGPCVAGMYRNIKANCFSRGNILPLLRHLPGVSALYGWTFSFSSSIAHNIQCKQRKTTRNYAS